MTAPVSRSTTTCSTDDGIELLSAYSSRAGPRALARHPDIAVVLLDVVMETETAGLELVDYIRRTLKNEAVRIILRTGQPGQAPERDVIVDYDINDYKSKTELTAAKLFTALDGRLARLWAAAPHGRHPARARDHHRRHGEPRRPQVAPSPCGGRPHAIRLTARRRMRRHSGAAGTATARARVRGSGRVGLLQRHGRAETRPSGLRPRPPRRSSRMPSHRRRNEFSQRTDGALHRNGKRRRDRRRPRTRERHLSETDRALIGIFCNRLAASIDNLVLYEQGPGSQSHAGTTRRRPHRGTGCRKPPARGPVVSAPAAATPCKARSSASWRTISRTRSSVILGRAEVIDQLLAIAPIDVERCLNASGLHQGLGQARWPEWPTRWWPRSWRTRSTSRCAREPNDLCRLLHEVVEANRLLADRKNQTLEISTGMRGTGFVRLRSDARRPRQSRQQRHQVQPSR